MAISKKIIFSADDFGKCDEMDYAILEGFKTGVLTSTCVMPNGNNYEKAINEILPSFKPLISEGGLGFHFNIIEGKSLLQKDASSFLCDSDGNYNRSYIFMLLNSFNKRFLEEVEAEFRSQIERLLSDAKEKDFVIDHVNSHVHVHSIPAFFDLVCRLSNEYGINCVRTQYEKFYFLSLKKIFSMGLFNAFLNLIKNILLKFFTSINRKTLDKYQIKTNDNFVGLLSTGFMDEESILKGLSCIRDFDSVTEVLVHPYFYENNKISDENKEKEFLLVKNGKIRTILEKKEYNFINFSRFNS